MLSVIAKLAVVSALMIFLGVIAIIMGFSAKWPNAETPGAIFFVGGWLLAGLVSVASHLEGILTIMSKKHESDHSSDS